MIAKEVGVDIAEKIVDSAIRADRVHNHTFVFNKEEKQWKSITLIQNR